MNITPAQRLTIVKHLAQGKSLDVVASIMRMSRDQVLDIGNHHGYPKTDRLAHAAEVLTRNLEEAHTANAISTSPTSPSGVPLFDRQEPTVVKTATLTVPTDVTSSTLQPPDEFRVLINTAKGHDSKRIQNLANRILDDTAKLRAMIRDDQEKHAAKRAAEREKQEARAEVDRLKKQLADAQAKLRSNTTTQSTANTSPARTTASTNSRASAAEIRAWARENNIDCPTRGRVPTYVATAYEQAHQDSHHDSDRGDAA